MYMPYVRYKFESNKSKNNFILLRESDAKIRIKIVSHTQEPYKKPDFSIFFSMSERTGTLRQCKRPSIE